MKTLDDGCVMTPLEEAVIFLLKKVGDDASNNDDTVTEREAYRLKDNLEEAIKKDRANV